jgi:hypothetical protein
MESLNFINKEPSSPFIKKPYIVCCIENKILIEEEQEGK